MCDTDLIGHVYSFFVSIRDLLPISRQVGKYVLDFPDNSTKLSVKNVQLVPTNVHGFSKNAQECIKNTRGCHNIAWGDGEKPLGRRGLRGEEELSLLSLGKSATDEFSLDFRWPLSPLQAFGLALAALDTNV